MLSSPPIRDTAKDAHIAPAIQHHFSLLTTVRADASSAVDLEDYNYHDSAATLLAPPMPREIDASPVLSYRLSLEEVPSNENAVGDESRFGEFNNLVWTPGISRKPLNLATCRAGFGLASSRCSLQFPSSSFFLSVLFTQALRASLERSFSTRVSASQPLC